MAKGSGGKKPDYSSWPYVDRRKRRTNPVQAAVAVIVGLGWLGLFTVFAMLDQASPQQTSFWHVILKSPVRSVWDAGLVRRAFYVMLGALGLGIAALIVSMTRARRKTDRLSRASLILIGLCGLGIVFFLIYFGGTITG